MQDWYPVRITRDYVVAYAANIVLLKWLDVPSSSAFDAVDGAIARAASYAPVVWLTVGNKTAISRSPPVEARAAAQRLLDSRGKDLAATAVLLEGESIRLSAVRMIVAGINLSSRLPCPSRVFAKRSEVAPFLGQFSDVGATSINKLLMSLDVDLSHRVPRPPAV